jgi:hypothetical protein
VSTLSRLRGNTSELTMQDSNFAIHQALQQMETKVEHLLTQKMQDTLVSTSNGSWAVREKKLIEIIDNQGKDIAVDFANMETQIAEIQRMLRL